MAQKSDIHAIMDGPCQDYLPEAINASTQSLDSFFQIMMYHMRITRHELKIRVPHVKSR